MSAPTLQGHQVEPQQIEGYYGQAPSQELIHEVMSLPWVAQPLVILAGSQLRDTSPAKSFPVTAIFHPSAAEGRSLPMS
jgi:hypothetical protein